MSALDSLVYSGRVDVRPEYDIAGPPDGHPIVLVHGTRLTRRMWLCQLEGLSDTYRLIAPDLPGHGHLAETSFALESAADRIAAVVDKETHGRALIVGLSLGGFVTMELAHCHPEKTVGLVLAGCTGDARGLLSFPYRFGTLLARHASEHWLHSMNSRLFRRMYPPRIAEPIIESGFYMKAVPEVISEVLSHDFLSKIRNFPGPVLFVNGERDKVFRADEARFVAAAGHARLEVIQQAGHLSNLDQPEAFNDILRRFAQSISWN